MVKAIIFDCFGVLVGSSFKEIFRQAGGNLERDESFVDNILAAANSGFMTVHEMHQQVADHLGIELGEWIKFVDAREQPNQDLINYAKTLKNNYKLAVLSNASAGVLPRKFTPEQQDLFDVVVASAEVGYMKPDSEIYTLTTQKLGVHPSECIYTDDSQIYCDAAEAVGMKSIFYQNFDQFKNDLDALLA